MMQTHYGKSLQSGERQSGSSLIKLAANLSMMFQDISFLERFAAAANAGFRGVEYLFPYEASAAEVRERLVSAGLTQVIFNTPPGNWAAGERGLAALPDRVAEFRAGLQKALEYARATDCRMLHVMAGIPGKADPAQVEQTYLDNLAYAAREAVKDGISIIVEPINTKVDIPGYYLTSTEQAVKLLQRLDLPNLRLQYDCYHMQIMEGDLARTIERLLPLISHMQLADNPGRHEPGTGEINYSWLLGKIDSLGYTGWIGCEYRPTGATVAGLGWAASWLDHKKN
jgi:hydroxypyruvate isomerase